MKSKNGVRDFGRLEIMYGDIEHEWMNPSYCFLEDLKYDVAQYFTYRQLNGISDIEDLYIQTFRRLRTHYIISNNPDKLANLMHLSVDESIKIIELYSIEKRETLDNYIERYPERYNYAKDVLNSRYKTVNLKNYNTTGYIPSQKYIENAVVSRDCYLPTIDDKRYTRTTHNVSNNKIRFVSISGIKAAITSFNAMWKERSEDIFPVLEFLTSNKKAREILGYGRYVKIENEKKWWFTLSNFTTVDLHYISSLEKSKKSRVKKELKKLLYQDSEHRGLIRAFYINNDLDNPINHSIINA